MAIAYGRDVVAKAADGGYAVAAINCQGGNYDLVRAIIETAEEERAPVIVMAYQANTTYYGIDWLPQLATHLAERVSIPVVTHLDHGHDPDTVKSAVDAGYTSVMIDYSQRSLAENIAATRVVIEHATRVGVSVEAELGQLQRNDQTSGKPIANLVEPGDVEEFLSAVPVDMLAVGIGNAHGFYKGEPNIRLDLLERVKAVAPDTPLVLHGTTGIPEPTVTECISRGVAKINFGTLVRTKFFQYVAEAIDGAADHNGHIWRVMEYACEAIKSEIRSIIRITGSAGRA